MTTRRKALDLNLDSLIYGSIAEIGAGQEVARHFFQAGGASGTVAKTLSAYDMNFSDAIYGPDESGRYVSRTRLERMLDTEYDVLVERVKKSRPEGSTFFAFADTVTAKKYESDDECHGWMGIKYQHSCGARPSRIVVHVRMLDSSNRGQQHALGVLGVNLIFAAFKHGGDHEKLIDTLAHDLDWGRLEIDYIHVDGPCFAGADPRQLNLRLVTSSLGPIVIFGSDGQAIVPSDHVYKKDVLIFRGSFRPFSEVHSTMMKVGVESFARELSVSREKIALLCEMNIARFLSDGVDEVSDLLERVEAITAHGHSVMVTSQLRYFRLAEYFSRHTRRKIGFLLSVDNLIDIFDEKYYDGLEGGILEAMGKLFASDSGLLVYPNLTPAGDVLTAENFDVPDHLVHLYRHLLHNGRILSLAPDRATLVPFEVRNRP